MSRISSSQESTSFAGPVDANFQLAPDIDITELLEQLYDLAQVKFNINFALYFIRIYSKQQIHEVKLAILSDTK